MTDKPICVCTEMVLTPEERAKAWKRALGERGRRPGAMEIAAETRKLWAPGRVLKVKFLRGGTSKVRDKVKEYASVWSQYANISFDFGDHADAEIRIAFDAGGSWSYVGTDALGVADATMNFGWFDDNTSEQEFRRVILHEFGHALGCIHEHQHPLAGIPWNRPVVYSYYLRTNGWKEATVDSNIFARYSTTTTNYTAYDPQSIMHYAIDKELTMDGYQVGWNNDLSETDKRFAGRLYRKQPGAQPPKPGPLGVQPPPDARPAPEMGPETAPAPIALGLNRGCELLPHGQQLTIGPMTLGASEVIAYASPDSTFAVTKPLIERAKRSILIGIYDFSAGYMKELLLAAMSRGIRVTLMLDVDSDRESKVFEELEQYGATCVMAPSCAHPRVHYFSSSHEKVIVIDDEWVLVQSGNYSVNSIPNNESDGTESANFVPGNRDMGIAVRNAELAGFFTAVLQGDIGLERKGLTSPPGAAAAAAPGSVGTGALPDHEMLVAKPPKRPERLFPSKRVQREALTVTPVLSPDNYMDVVPDLLRNAKTLIQIQQQYIKSHQANVTRLLEIIRDRMNADKNLIVQIVLAAPFPGSNPAVERQAYVALEAFGLKLGEHVRILNPAYFVHNHNKLVIVDQTTVLISSQNWSDAALSRNREAGLVVNDPELAQYYGQIFASDWDTALTDVGLSIPAVAPTEALGLGRPLLRATLADYQEI